MKKHNETDVQIKEEHFRLIEYVLTYSVLLVLSAGQALIMSEYIEFEKAPVGYIGGMLGYCAIVTAIFCFVTNRQRFRVFDRPMSSAQRVRARI